MNLQSSIRRDGVKVHYLNIPEEVEAKAPSLLSVLINKISQKFLSLRVVKINRKKQHL